MDNVKGFTNTRKINEEAARWILLIEDTPKLSKDQIAALNRWVATSDVHRECLTSMVDSWGEMSLLASVMQPREVKASSSKATVKAWLLAPLLAFLWLLDHILLGVQSLLRPIIMVPTTLAFVGWLTFSVLQPTTLEANNASFLTSVGQQSQHILEDGSTIWLNSNSEVLIDFSEQTRRVNLVKGEAHFEVAKDQDRPFEVYASDRLVRAIGTAFSVYRLEDRIEVLVTEGKVELAIANQSLVVKPDNYDAITVANLQDGEVSETHFDNDEGANRTQEGTRFKNHVLGELVAGQRISIPTANMADTTSLLNDIIEVDSSEVTRKLSWREGKLVFAGESLEEVVKEITRHTKIRIDVFDPALKKMRIGGQFKTGETDSLFYVLETGFGISVDKVDKNHVQLHVKDKSN